MIRFFFAAVFSGFLVTFQPAYGQLFESHYLFRNGYPIAQTAWSFRVEGVAHDDNFWYLTRSRLPATTAFQAILKVPVGADLASVTSATPGVSVFLVSNVNTLFDFQSFGDPDVFRFNGIDYLVVPLSRGGGCLTQLASVAFFRCDTLALVGVAPLPGIPCGAEWVAVSAAGELFTSFSHVGLPNPDEQGLRVYNVNWAALSTTDPVTITFNRNIPMWKENGQPLELFHMQGGDFAAGDQLLYLSSGFVNDDNATADSEGIHVIDTTSFQRVRHSSRGVAGQLFDFYYNPGGSTSEQPQGLTLWDLDDGRAPGILGQLHVLVGENFFDTVDFKHYTRAISVNPSGPACQTGTPQCPWHSIGAALTNAWPGSEIRIRGGTYPSPLIVNQRVRINAENGVVRLGG